MKQKLFYKRSIALLICFILIFSQILNVFPAFAEGPNAEITILSPKAILEPSQGNPGDKDEDGSSSADPEEFVLAAKIVTNVALTNPAATLADNNLSDGDDLQIDGSPNVNIGYLDGNNDNVLNPGTYYMYWNLHKDQAVALEGHQEAYTVSISYDGGGPNTSSQYNINFEKSTAITQSDLDFLESGYTPLGDTGSSFTITSKYQQSSSDLDDLILQNYYDGNLLRLDKVNVYFYNGGTGGSVVEGAVPAGYTNNWVDKTAFSQTDLDALPITNDDNWVTSYSFTILQPIGTSTIWPYNQTKDSHVSTSTWKTDSGYRVTVNSKPILRIVKSANPDPDIGPVKPGDQITYYLDYYNNSPATALGVVVADTIPENTTFSSAEGGSYDSATKTITWNNIGDVPGGGQGQVSFTVTVNSPLPNGTTINNFGTISASNATPVDSNIVTHTVKSEPKLSIVKSSDPAAGDSAENAASVDAGSNINYTLTYTNDGSDGTSEVSIVDALPGNITVDEASISNGGTYDVGSNKINWSLPGLSVGETGTITFSVKVDDVIANGTMIENFATISSPQTQPVDSNHTFHKVVSGPVLSIDKTADPAEGTNVDAGSTISYTLNFTNSGSDAASDVIVSDELPSYLTSVSNISDGGSYNPVTNKITWPTIASLAAEADVTYTFNATVASVIVDGTAIINTARLVSGETNLTSTTTHYAHSEPKLSIDKTANPVEGASVDAGSTIAYTLNFKNTGSDAAKDVIVTDELPSYLTSVANISDGGIYDPATNKITWPTIASLAAGSNISYTFDAKVASVIVDETEIINTGRITSGEINLSDSTTHYAHSKPVLSIVKSSESQERTIGQIKSSDTTNVITKYLSTKITFTAKPNKIKKGKTTILRGTLKDSKGKAIAKKNVTIKIKTLKKIKKKVNGKIKTTKKYVWKKYRTARTNKKGQFKLKVRLNKAHEFRAFYDGEKPKKQISSEGGYVKIPGTVDAGAKIKYTLTYANNGTDAASAVIIKDAIPAYTKVDLSSISDGGVYDEGTNTIAWTRPALAVGGTGQVSFSVYVDQSIPKGTVITNYGTVTSPDTEKTIESNRTQDEINSSSIRTITNVVTTQTVNNKSASKGLRITVTQPKKKTAPPAWVYEGDNG